MPFKSESQRRLCYVLYDQDIKTGKTPKWDCKKWEEETYNKNLPWKKGGKSMKQIIEEKEHSLQRTVYTGPRGGKYTIVDGKKRYIRS